MPPEQKPQNSQNNSIPVGEGLDSPGLAGMIETESNQTALENQALDALSFARADEASLEPSVTTLAETTPLTAEDVPKPTTKYFPQMVRVGVAALVVLLVGLGFFGGKKALDYQHNLAKQGSIATNYATNSSPLNDLANQAASGLSVVTDSSARLTVNGTLDVNGSLVINQSGTPTKPVKGQIYYSKTDNKLYFYNGLTFIDITYASTAPTSVTSVQGQAGAVTFTAGNGIAINGTTISSTVPGGVKSLFSGSANLSISSDGNGGYTITDANGGVGVELQNSTPGSPQTGNINITGTVIAGSFQGDGSGLTNLNASNLASGTVSDARLSTNVTLAGNAFNGVNQLVQLDGSGFLPALNGSALTNLNASNVATGTLNDARLSANVTLQGNIFNGANQLLKLNPSGDLPALSGINLTNLNASEVTAGTLPDVRLSANVTLMGNTFNGANQLLQLTNLGYLPVVNGSNLTSLNASSLASGTVADARLSANVALLNGNQTFSGSNTFSSAINANTLTPSAALTLGAAAQSFTLQGNGSSTITSTKSGFTTTVGFAGTPIGNVVYNFDNSVTAGTYTICTTYGNCSGTGGGVTTVGGTTNKLARFTGAQTIGDSAISDTGAIVTIQNSSDSINGFQIQNTAGTSNLFVADTTNTRIGIGKTSPGYTLDVNGDINSATGLRVGGNLVCDSSGCTSGSGSGFYIQNGTSLQTSANFNIQSAAAGSVGGVIKGAVGQTADLFDLVQGATTVIKFTPTGNVDITGVYKVNGTQITSADLGDNSNIAHLNGTQAFTGNNTFSGTILQQNAADSVAAFRIQNAAGTSNLFVADTTNTRIGIGTPTPGYTLDVNGDINIPTGAAFRINGVAICGVAPTCAPSSGSTYYIQNSTAQQTNANFNIMSANGSSVGGIIRGNSGGQTADLLRLQDASGANVAVFSNAGTLSLGQNLAATGTIVFKHTSVTGSTTLTLANPGTNSYTLTLPAETGTLCSTGSVCAGYAASSGSGNYIQNGTTIQTAANFAIQSAAAGSIGAVVRGATSQAASLQEWQDSTGAVLASFNSSGKLAIGATPASTGDIRLTGTGSYSGLYWRNTGNTGDIAGITSDGTNLIIGQAGASTNFPGLLRVNSATGTAGTVEKFRISLPVTVDNAANAIISASAAAAKPLVIQGAASQSASLQEWQDSTGTALLAVQSNGRLNFGTSTQAVVTANSILFLRSTGSVIRIQDSASGNVEIANGGGNVGVGVAGGSIAARLHVAGAAAGTPVSIFQGFTAQSADLTQWQNSGGIAVSGVNSAGGLYLGRSATFTGTAQFFSSANTGSITLQANNPATNTYTLNLPAENGTLCSTGSVCSGYAGSTGAAGYIQNGTSVQSNANFAIQSAAAGSTGAVIKGATSQSANLQEWQASTGGVLASIGPTGAFTLQNSSDSTAAVSVATAVGSKVLTVDTTNQKATLNQLSAPGTVTPTRLDAPATPTVTPTGTTGAISYSYKVVALMSTGFLTAPSSAGNTTTGNATLTSGNYNTVSWSAVAGASAYYVYRTSSSGSPSTTGWIGYTTSTSLNDTGSTATQASPLSSNLSNGTTYYYKVTAIDGLGGETTTSTEASQAINASNQAIVLTWTAIPGARSYRVYRGTSSGAQTAYYVTSTNSFTDIYAIGSFTTGTTPTANNAYATIFSNGANAQLTVGNSGTPTGQLYLGGNLPPLVSIANTGTPGSIYYSYQVVPLNSSGSIMAGPYGGAGTSTGNAILDGTNYNIVSWAATPGAATYNIYRIVVGSGGSPTTLGLIGNTASTTFNDTGLAGGGSGTWPVNGAISTDASSIPSNIIPQGRYAYAVGSGSGTFKTYDISNPSNPAMLGAAALNNASGSQVTVDGRYAYVLENGGKQFEVIDIANPAKPVSAAVVSYRDSNFNSITSQGRYLYLSGDIDLRIYDITNPTVPAIVASTGGGGSSSYPVAAGRYVFYLGGNAQTLGAYDVASPTSPVSVGTVSLGAAGNMLRISGRYAYVLIPSTKTMKVIDISNPASMAVIATVSTTGQPKGLAVTGRYAYVTPYVNGNTGTNTVEVFDIANPAVPVRVSSYTTGTNTGGGSMTTYLATQGRYLYVALGAGNGSGGLQVIDMGGEYAQNFEAGAAQADTLSVTSAANFNGGASIGGGLQVTGDTSVTGDLGVSGAARFQGAVQLAGGIQGGVSITGLTTPSAPTVLPQGTSGATAYSYQVVAVAANGGTTPTSASGSTATGNATLSTTNFNNLTWTPVAGALSYRIYRVSSSGTPSSTGLIGTTGGNVLNDTGLAGDSSSAPTTDISGSVILGSNAAASGVLRLANAAAISWRNAAGTGDKVIKLSSNNTTDGLDMPGQLVVGGSDSTAGAISFFSTQVKIGRTGNSGFYVNTGIQTFEVLNSSKNSAVGIGAASDFTNGTVEKLRVGTVTTVDNAAYATFGATAAANKALVIQGAASQSANLQEWQDSSANALVSVSAGGDFLVNHTGNNFLTIKSSNSGSANIQFGVAGTGPRLTYDPVGGSLQFYQGGAEKARLTSGGVLELNSTGTVGTVEKLRVNTPTTVDNAAATILSTGATGNKGLVIQAIASQSANLQEWQDSTGAALAFITAAGDLTVKSGTFNGTLTVNGHIISGNTSGTTTVAAGAGAGTGATASISGNDTAGVITVNTGTGDVAGIQATVTFANAYGVAPKVVITPKDVPGGGIFPQYQYNSGTTTFDLKTFNALTDSSTYTFSYQIIQ